MYSFIANTNIGLRIKAILFDTKIN